MLEWIQHHVDWGRENTRLAHIRELRKALEYTEFAEAEAELRVWVDARAWTTGESPKALFDAAVGVVRGTAGEP